MERKKSPVVLPLCLGGVFLLFFLVLIVLLKTVDVAAVGPAGTSVGLSQINGSFHEWIPFHEVWYKITKVLGVLALALAALVAIWSLVQWIRRKSLWKVDATLLALDVLYIVTGVLYLLFELVVVNYRPVLLEGQTFPAASFPSSHTLLACVIFGSAFWPIAVYLRRTWQVLAAWGAAGALLVLTVIGRMLSGVHWLSDIWGGLFLGAVLVCFFQFVLIKLEEKQKKTQTDPAKQENE